MRVHLLPFLLAAAAFGGCGGGNATPTGGGGAACAMTLGADAFDCTAAVLVDTTQDPEHPEWRIRATGSRPGGGSASAEFALAQRPVLREAYGWDATGSTVVDGWARAFAGAAGASAVTHEALAPTAEHAVEGALTAVFASSPRGDKEGGALHGTIDATLEPIGDGEAVTLHAEF